MRSFLSALIICITFDIAIFFPLFYPFYSLIITPEFGGGDLMLVNYPSRYFVCKNILKPVFWEPHIGFGYPILAEYQLAFYNPITSLLGCFFGYKLSWYILVFYYLIVAQIGLLLLAKEFKFDKFVGILFSLIVPFLPLYIINLMHTYMITVLYCLPLSFALFLRLLRQPDTKLFFLFVLSLINQLLAGHYQIFFANTVFLVTFFIVLAYIKKYKLRYIIKILASSYLISFLLLGFLLFPTIEFLRNSDRYVSLLQNYAILFDQNLNINSLLTLLNPYFFGRPQNGTYAYRNFPDPWECIQYIYLIPFVFLVYALLKKKLYRNTIFLSCIVTALIMFLLALGRNSPIYIIHALPFFSSFRFPSRYLLYVVFIFVTISFFGLNTFLNKRNKKAKSILTIVLLLFLFFEITKFFYSFHISISNEKVFGQNPIIKYLESKPHSRIHIPYYVVKKINNNYIKKGYANNNFPFYQYSSDFLLGNTGIVYSIRTTAIKSGPLVKRYEIFKSFIDDIKVKKNKVFLSNRAKNSILIAGIDYILSPYAIEDNLVEKKIKYKRKDYSIYLYKVKQNKSRFQFYDKFKYINSYDDVISYFDKSENFGKKEVLVEKNIYANFNPKLKLNYLIKIHKDDNDYISFTAITNKKSLFVLADTYYPSWECYINGKKVDIFRANILFRGIIVPEGKNYIEFKNSKKSFLIGFEISVLSFFLLFVLRKKISDFLLH